MFVCTLLTNPARPSLDAALVENLRNAWGGTNARWLAADEAAAFSLATQPDNQWQVWADVQAMGVDMAILPQAGQQKAVLLADMDSTMIEQECIDELADAAGVGSHVKEITARAMNGELNFEDAIRERVGLLKDLPASVIDQVLKDRISLMPGASVLLSTMKANGAYAALVSGGFTAFTSAVATTLGFDENRANTLLSENGVLTGKVGQPILGQQAKVDALDDIVLRRGITADQVLAVGDGANDLGMLGRAGLGVALHAKPKVAEQCDVRINFGDLTALLYLQGYSKSDFVAL